MGRECLMDGGFLSDACCDSQGREIPCAGTLVVQYYQGKDGQHNRKLYCVGVPRKQRHRLHWLQGSVFQGHSKLDAKDVSGILHCFATGNSVEVASMDTRLNRDTCQILLDKLRMASALVAVEHRQNVVFTGCQVEADESVVRKEKVYDVKDDGSKDHSPLMYHIMGTRVASRREWRQRVFASMRRCT